MFTFLLNLFLQLAVYVIQILASAPSSIRVLLFALVAMLAITAISRGFHNPYKDPHAAGRASLNVLAIILATDILGYFSMLVGPPLYPVLYLKSTIVNFLLGGGIGLIASLLLISSMPQVLERGAVNLEDNSKKLKLFLLSMIIVWVSIRRCIFESCFFFSPFDPPGCFETAHAARALATGIACGLIAWIYKWTLSLKESAQARLR